MSRMNPLVYYTLTISLTVLSASAATSQCHDKIASCSNMSRVCEDPVASVHICPLYCEKCEEYNNLPRASCQNKVDTFFCEMAANCIDKFHVYLCPLTCGKCELVTSQTSTVTASSTIVSTTSPSTSTFTRTSTLMSNQSRPTSPTTTSTTSQALPIVTESTTGATMSSVSGRVTRSSTIVSTTSPSTSTFTQTYTLMPNQSRPTSPTTASATSQTLPAVTESTTAATMSSVPGRASIASPSTSTSTRTSAHTSTYQTSPRPETTTTGPQTSTMIAGSTIVSTMDTQKSSTPELGISETSTMTVSSTIESTTSRLLTLIMISVNSSTYKTSTWSYTTITARPTWTMITRSASASTMDTHKSSTPATAIPRHLKPSVCSQCGNLDGDLPCTDEEIFTADSSQCHDDTPYCMNDIIQTNGQMNMYKRCVNETICNSEWYMESSDKQQCTQFDPSIYKDDLVCHLCCYGDDCNANNVPPAEKLYKP